MTPEDLIQKSKRIVIKVGSVLLTDEKFGEGRTDWLESFAKDIRPLLNQDKDIVIVSSGSIALGRRKLGISYDDAPTAIPLEMKQAAAAIGQVDLAKSYHEAFFDLDMQVAMILLTFGDTEGRRTHLNARATINTLLSKNIVPIINENDTVSTKDIRFGDNDRLAARVAQMIEADLFIQLSTTDGLYTSNPDKDPKAEHISVVEDLTDEYLNMAGEARPGLSTGGMKSKLEAVQIAVAAGTNVIITQGVEHSPISKLQRGARCTIFPAKIQPGNARKRWILGHLKPSGTVILDDGAANAVVNDNKSLLPAGVTAVEGDFERGDPVTIKDKEGNTIGVGLSAYDSDEAQQIIGHQSHEIAHILGYRARDELIHRDDLALQS